MKLSGNPFFAVEFGQTQMRDRTSKSLPIRCWTLLLPPENAVRR